MQSAKWRNVFSGQQVGVPLSICVICANCTICKSCFQFGCNLKNEEMPFQIYSLEDRTLINLCNFCKLQYLQKLFSIWVQSAKWGNVFSGLQVGVPLSNCVICANCTICKSCFQLECNLQNEEMTFQIYSLENRTLINLCNLCKLHNLQKLFSIWLQSAKWRNVFSGQQVGVPLSICVICANCTICKSCFQFECNLQNEEMSFRFPLRRIGPLSFCVICANCTIYKSCFQFDCNLQNEEMSFRFPLRRIGPLSICVICANCTICKSCFQFECNLQNEEMSFRIYSLEDRTLINLCNLCKLHNLQKLFSIWVQSAKWRNLFQISASEDCTVIHLCNLC